MKKTLLVLNLILALPIAPLRAEWRDYMPSVPFWNSAKSEDKENVVLTEREQLIQSAKKYAYTGAALLALYITLKETPLGDYLKKCFREGLVRSYNRLCDVTGDYKIHFFSQNPVLKYICWEFFDTLDSIAQLSKVASFACLGKAGYDLVKAPFAQSNAIQETSNS
jgi:hypothetical protein